MLYLAAPPALAFLACALELKPATGPDSGPAEAEAEAPAPAPAGPTEGHALCASFVPAGVGPQRIALLVRDGVHRAQVDRLIERLELQGHDTRVLADRLGSVLCGDGSRLAVDASLRRWPAWYFDSAVRLSGPASSPDTLSAAEAAFLQPGSDGSRLPLTRLPWPASTACTH